VSLVSLPSVDELYPQVSAHSSHARDSQNVTAKECVCKLKMNVEMKSKFDALK
jgi:hypothetical protein